MSHAAARRLFTAIDLPRDVCRRLSGLPGRPPRGVRPVNPGQIHLTLHFLGNVEDERRAALGDALGKVRPAKFTIAIRGTGVFPPTGRPTILWAGIADAAPLAALHEALANAIAACGLAVEQRPYVPHVTLARLTPAAPRDWTTRFLHDTADLTIAAVPVHHFRLYWSHTRDGLTVHTPETTFPLQD